MDRQLQGKHVFRSPDYEKKICLVFVCLLTALPCFPELVPGTVLVGPWLVPTDNGKSLPRIMVMSREQIENRYRINALIYRRYLYC